MTVPEEIPLKHLLCSRELKSLHQAPPQGSEQTLQIPLISLQLKNFYPYEIQSIPELNSDHNPIALNLVLQYSIHQYPGKLETNWKKFKDTLKNTEFINPHFVNTWEQLDSIVWKIVDEIINANISTSNPVKENYIYHDNKLWELHSDKFCQEDVSNLP
ncbi:hypothetical protein AVEN_235706-1 [Araneus ventricosus]|uniref:Endonuclease/exonuclease/phosphatase domain-containing protein n=1 Tax=Araneus ventricosus TaxID=182803 RepID=A0A4Y2VCF9_ARAVE|nr:hypothetical protein AVEN_235706-1 [Araneus ventricosus]